MKFLKHILFSILFYSIQTVKAVPILNSMPSNISKVIYLDFDGQMVQSNLWNNYVGDSFYVLPSLLSDNDIISAFKVVSEDYIPFDVNVTTSLASYLNASPISRIRVIISNSHNYINHPLNSVPSGGVIYPSLAGVMLRYTFYNVFTPPNAPVEGFVFETSLGGGNLGIKVGETCTHEAGHSLGLFHTLRPIPNSSPDCTNPLEVYHTGFPSNDINSVITETSWVPIMGRNYYGNLTQWTNDFCGSQNQINCITNGLCGNPLAIGIGLKPDDYPNTASIGLQDLFIFSSTYEFNKSGIITASTDKDYFKLNITSNLPYTRIKVKPTSLNELNERANLDVMLKLYDNNLNLINTFSPPNSLDVLAELNLSIGTYYLEVSGTDNMNMQAFTNSGDGNLGNPSYGSIGSYTLTGFKGYITTTSGNWNVDSTWVGGSVPPINANVIVRHNVNVTQNAECSSIILEKNTGNVDVLTGYNLKINN